MIVLRILWLPALVLLVTLAWLWLDRLMGWKGVQLPWVAIPLAWLGAALIVWCAILFFRHGQGSPHPFVAKTKRLVTSGPYGVVRNPMMWGVGAEIVAVCLYLGSVGLWFGFACFLFFLHFFVPGYEERDMERRFGQEYREYCRRVPRWVPRLRRRQAKSAAASG